MDQNGNLPPNIEGLVSDIKELEAKNRLTNTEKKRLCLCKLKIAVWACRSEGLELSRYALTEILGPDSSEVFSKTEQAMAEIQWDNAEDNVINKSIKSKYITPRKGKKSGGGLELFK